ncbi:hypothetical protein PAMC26577_16615 [Caballeronia sordidicola]|uniref:Uncharacterized protein n=1 Tax=Caballeronia sordidicola TaxID=196367 RepID=A0A242MSW9_CABSO|nr:hypothetical protein PAMC26577_16615 [Caballeronia sordidicola]
MQQNPVRASAGSQVPCWGTRLPCETQTFSKKEPDAYEATNIY